jgi:hypothetical protein
MKECIWVDTVCDLLDEALIGEESVADARNLLGHDRQSRLPETQYIAIKERVTAIFSRMDSELPILGEIEDEHELGAYIFIPHWENVRKWCYLRANAELDQDTIYYLPPNSLQGESVIHAESAAIIECSAKRVLDNLTSYAEIQPP